ncbi:MAG TPA: hypothetical protein EYP56_19720, partial [Planctomycetaceae bacterium]|nr:hypothetical protein [Planctomycetaceae bacterium]
MPNVPQCCPDVPVPSKLKATLIVENCPEDICDAILHYQGNATWEGSNAGFRVRMTCLDGQDGLADLEWQIDEGPCQLGWSGTVGPSCPDLAVYAAGYYTEDYEHPMFCCGGGPESGMRAEVDVYYAGPQPSARPPKIPPPCSNVPVEQRECC